MGKNDFFFFVMWIDDEDWNYREDNDQRDIDLVSIEHSARAMQCAFQMTLSRARFMDALGKSVGFRWNADFDTQNITFGEEGGEKISFPFFCVGTQSSVSNTFVWWCMRRGEWRGQEGEEQEEFLELLREIGKLDERSVFEGAHPVTAMIGGAMCSSLALSIILEAQKKGQFQFPKKKKDIKESGEREWVWHSCPVDAAQSGFVYMLLEVGDFLRGRAVGADHLLKAVQQGNAALCVRQAHVAMDRMMQSVGLSTKQEDEGKKEKKGDDEMVVLVEGKLRVKLNGPPHHRISCISWLEE